MDKLTHTAQIDLALVKRDAALHYVRKRCILRTAVRMGFVTAAEARSQRYELIEHKTTWRAARALLRGC